MKTYNQLTQEQRYQIYALKKMGHNQTEIAKVILGDKTEMTLDALPDEKFNGKVIKIDPAETVVSGVIYYKVTSIFESKDENKF